MRRIDCPGPRRRAAGVRFGRHARRFRGQKVSEKKSLPVSDVAKNIFESMFSGAM